MTNLKKHLRYISSWAYVDDKYIDEEKLKEALEGALKELNK